MPRGWGAYAYMGVPQKYFSTFYKEIFMVDRLNAVVPLEEKMVRRIGITLARRSRIN